MTLTQFKVVKNLLLSGVILAFSWLLVTEGAEPTLVGVAALSLVAVLNGVDLAEWYAVWGEVQRERIKQQSSGGDDTDE